jgi:hypothetical protein
MMAKTLTLRLNEDQESMLGDFMEEFGHKTASKALLAAMADYRRVYEKMCSTVSKLNEAEEKLEEQKYAMLEAKHAVTALYNIIGQERI